MEARHEIIPFDSDSPVRLFMHKLGDVSRHWHESLELLFVLSGDVTVLAGDRQYTLQPDDMLLINSNLAHELHSDGGVLIAVQIKLSKFDLPPELLKTLYFDCNSRTAAAQQRFSGIKRIIASMLRTSAQGGDVTLLSNRALAYQLLAELAQNFKGVKPSGEAATQKHLARLNSILGYINTHYREQITLNQLAEREHLSAPYLSSFFEKHMGINFTTYYTNLRLERAVRDLLYTDVPVEQVALNCGFSDPRSFVRAFKKRYGTVPSAYRKNAAAHSVQREDDPLQPINYLDFSPENYLHILSRHLQEHDSAEPAAPSGGVRALDLGRIDSVQTRGVLEHKWRNFIGVGRAKELLGHEVQEMLRALQRDVGFRYLRFHGILSDDMLVCQRGKDGALQFSFVLVDRALDFVLSLGLKPLIQFSFMPAAIAADPSRTIFASPFVISPPGKMEEWNQLVLQFLVHIRNRYGRDEIRSWLFSVWNEPDTSQDMFGFARREEFFSLYRNTWHTVKAFDPALVFGSPSVFPVADEDYTWLNDYLDFAGEQACLPEFMDVHYYSDNFQGVPSSEADFSVPSRFNGDPDHFGKFLTKVRQFFRSKGLGDLPLYITEWNLTVSHRNLINDTCFKATYVAKNFLENYDRADAIGYWSLTDLLEEYQPDQHLFHGGMGLFTQNGIKKPPYYAMQMLRRLGDELVASGEGYFITRRGGGLVMVLYNYEHCNPLFVEEGFGLTLTSRDGVFPHRNSLEVSLTLTQMGDGVYRIRETILNQENGSCFDKWVAMGAAEPGGEDAEWLRRNTGPALHIYQSAASRGELSYTAALAPHEVRLVEIIPVEQGYHNY